MIEIIQENSKTEDNLEGKLPKNIRQIGNPEKDFRIYMEDYVYTYLHPARMQEDIPHGTLRLLILLGEIEHFSSRSCAFISGAIQVPNSMFLEEEYELDENVWQMVRSQIRQYFPKSEIIGWVLDLGGRPFEITEKMEKLHGKHFSGKFQLLFLMDTVEREEAFYMWKQGQLNKKEGYFIYYEKNPQMQEYMISQKEAEYGEVVKEEEVDDKAAQNYRAMMLEKKEQVVKGHWSFGTYATYALLILSLCTVSVVLLGSIKKVEHMENAISMLSVSMESTEKNQKNTNNQVSVETISGNVVPLNPEGEKLPEANVPAVADSAAEPEPEQNVPEPGVQGAEEPEPAAQAPEPTAQAPTAQAPEAQNPAAQEGATEPVAQGAEEPEEPVAQEPEQPKEEAVPEKSEADIWKEQGYYVVQTGDSLRQICYKIYKTYAVMEKLCEVNGISDENSILAGQKLILP